MSSMRQSCTQCGRSCHGVRVRLMGEEERARMVQAGVELGVDQPVVEGRLRQTQDGRCVFLNEGGLCGIHMTLGAEVKPLICRQYPWVKVATESGLRIGVDPGCYSAFSTRQTGDKAPPNETLTTTDARFDPPFVQTETALLAVLGSPGQTVSGALSALAGRPGQDLPPGFERRLVQMLTSEGLAKACRHPSAGPAVRAGLAPILEALPVWLASGPPTMAWVPNLEQWGLEVSRRLVWLRLCPRLPSPMVVCLMSLCGAMVAHWVAQGDPRRYAQTLAVWARAMRSPMFWGALFPEGAAVHALLRGG